MKKSKLLIISMFFAFSFLAITPAHATTTQTTQSSSIWSGFGDWWDSLFGGKGSGSGSGTGSGTGSGSGTSLPINGNMWFLVAAGAAVGCKVIIKNSKQVQLQRA